MNMQPPLQRTANQLSDYGRFGDSTLVHMNPAEVSGLASMSPTGELTINPVTGQPEAFLPFLAPLLGSALGSAALGGTIGTAAAGALGSGLATWAATGDFEKGLISGVTGFGLGKVFGAAGDAGEAVQAANRASDVASAAGVDPSALQAAQKGAEAFGLTNPTMDQAGGFTAGFPEILPANPQPTFGGNLANIGRGLTSGQGIEAATSQLMSPSSAIPMAIGEGTRAQVEAQEEMEKLRRENTARDSRYAQSWRDTLTDSLGMARGSNPNPYMGRFASGGIVGYNGGGDILGNTPAHTNAMSDEEYRDLWGDMDVDESAGLGTGAFGLDADSRYKMDRDKLTPDSGAYRQSFLRGDIKQDPPSDYRHGFEEEFQFFDFIEDRPIERYADLFGAGSSNYLAGLLAGNQGDAPTTDTEEVVPGTYSESTITCYPTDGGEAFDVTGVNPVCPVGSGTAPPAATLRKTCYVANEDGTYGTALADLTGVCPVGYYDSEAAAAAAVGTTDTETTITCYNDQTGESQSVTGVGPTCPVGWSETEPVTELTPQEQCELAGGVWDGENCDMGGGGTETTITCYNADGQTQQVTGVNPSCPVGWSEIDPTAGGTETTITCYNQETGESQSVTGVNPSCPTGWAETEPVPDWLQTLQGISPDVDGDYSQGEADAIVGLIDSGFDTQKIADYYGMSVDELMGYYDTIKAAPLAAALASISPDVDGDYTQVEANQIVALIDGGADAQQIADYYGMTVDELMGYYNSLKGGAAALGEITAAEDVDGDYSESEADAVWNLYMDGKVSAKQIADYYNMTVDEFLAAVEQRSAAKAGDTQNVAIDTSTLEGAGTVKDITDDQIATIIGDTTSVDAGQMPNTGAWDTMGTSYIGDEAGTLEAAYATAEYDNMMEQQQNIRNFVADNYGEPPYSQEQALDFAAGAIGAGLAAEEVAAALDIDLATVQSLYEAVGSASGGQVGTKRFMTPLGMVHMANGGIAELPANLPMTQEVPQEVTVMESEEIIEEPMPDTDYPELVDMTIEAIRGNVEDPDAIINQFIDEYGPEAFKELRAAVLQSIVPNAQTEGMIDGAGGGMDDEVMGMIGEDQQIAVSPGEYIVAADVVSGLGDGNSDTGAEVLDEMMQGVRNARTGGRQPKPINKAAVMPA